MRRSTTRETTECQTVIHCTPLLLNEGDVAIVVSNQNTQTIVTCEPVIDDNDFYPQLMRLDPAIIEQDYYVTFDLPYEDITLETHNDENGNSNLTNKLSEIVRNPSIQVDEREGFDEKITQTRLMVFPHYLRENEVAVISTDMYSQTTVSSEPQSSIQEIIPNLKSFLKHDDSELEETDVGENRSIVDILLKIVRDIEDTHKQWIDNYVLPENSIREDQFTPLDNEEKNKVVIENTSTRVQVDKEIQTLKINENKETDEQKANESEVFDKQKVGENGLIDKQKGCECKNTAEEKVGKSEDTSEQKIGESEDTDEQKANKSGDIDEQKVGESGDTDEQKTKESEDTDRKKSTESKNTSELKVDKSEHTDEQRANESGDTDEQKIGESEDTDEQKANESEDNNEQKVNEIEDTDEQKTSEGEDTDEQKEGESEDNDEKKESDSGDPDSGKTKCHKCVCSNLKIRLYIKNLGLPDDFPSKNICLELNILHEMQNIEITAIRDEYEEEEEEMEDVVCDPTCCINESHNIPINNQKNIVLPDGRKTACPVIISKLNKDGYKYFCQEEEAAEEEVEAEEVEEEVEYPNETIEDAEYEIEAVSKDVEQENEVEVFDVNEVYEVKQETTESNIEKSEADIVAEADCFECSDLLRYEVIEQVDDKLTESIEADEQVTKSEVEVAQPETTLDNSEPVSCIECSDLVSEDEIKEQVDNGELIEYTVADGQVTTSEVEVVQTEGTLDNSKPVCCIECDLLSEDEIIEQVDDKLAEPIEADGTEGTLNNSELVHCSECSNPLCEDEVIEQVDDKLTESTEADGKVTTSEMEQVHCSQCSDPLCEDEIIEQVKSTASTTNVETVLPPCYCDDNITEEELNSNVEEIESGQLVDIEGNESVRELVENIVETELIENIVETEPVENIAETELVENIFETELVENIFETEPVENSIETVPVENVAETEPVENIVETELVENIFETELVENIFETEPVENSIESEPVENIVETEPKDDIEETEPKDAKNDIEEGESVVDENIPTEEGEESEFIEEELKDFVLPWCEKKVIKKKRSKHVLESKAMTVNYLLDGKIMTLISKGHEGFDVVINIKSTLPPADDKCLCYDQVSIISDKQPSVDKNGDGNEVNSSENIAVSTSQQTSENQSCECNPDAATSVCNCDKLLETNSGSPPFQLDTSDDEYETCSEGPSTSRSKRTQEVMQPIPEVKPESTFPSTNAQLVLPDNNVLNVVLTLDMKNYDQICPCSKKREKVHRYYARGSKRGSHMSRQKYINKGRDYVNLQRMSGPPIFLDDVNSYLFTDSSRTINIISPTPSQNTYVSEKYMANTSVFSMDDRSEKVFKQDKMNKKISFRSTVEYDDTNTFASYIAKQRQARIMKENSNTEDDEMQPRNSNDEIIINNQMQRRDSDENKTCCSKDTCTNLKKNQKLPRSKSCTCIKSNEVKEESNIPSEEVQEYEENKLPEISCDEKQDVVYMAFKACEEELKPVITALSNIRQELKDLNIPEVDSIFKSDIYLDIPSRTAFQKKISALNKAADISTLIQISQNNNKRKTTLKFNCTNCNSLEVPTDISQQSKVDTSQSSTNIKCHRPECKYNKLTSSTSKEKYSTPNGKLPVLPPSNITQNAIKSTCKYQSSFTEDTNCLFAPSKLNGNNTVCEFDLPFYNSQESTLATNNSNNQNGLTSLLNNASNIDVPLLTNSDIFNNKYSFKSKSPINAGCTCKKQTEQIKNEPVLKNDCNITNSGKCDKNIGFQYFNPEFNYASTTNNSVIFNTSVLPTRLSNIHLHNAKLSKLLIDCSKNNSSFISNPSTYNNSQYDYKFCLKPVNDFNNKNQLKSQASSIAANDNFSYADNTERRKVSYSTLTTDYNSSSEVTIKQNEKYLNTSNGKFNQNYMLDSSDDQNRSSSSQSNLSCVLSEEFVCPCESKNEIKRKCSKASMGSPTSSVCPFLKIMESMIYTDKPQQKNERKSSLSNKGCKKCRK